MFDERAKVRSPTVTHGSVGPLAAKVQDVTPALPRL
jgi:hypothetical protein